MKSSLNSLTRMLVIVVFGLVLNGCHTSNWINGDKPVDDNQNHLETLEVTSVYKRTDGKEVSLISLDHKMRYQTVINKSNLINSNLETTHLTVGDRVKINGIYLESYPVKIVNIKQITQVDNPDKTACEANSNRVWQPEGMAQIPTCVTVYSDGGKSCDSSTDCEGSCVVHDTIANATCAKNDSGFGCGATIEDFKINGSIICVD